MLRRPAAAILLLCLVVADPAGGHAGQGAASPAPAPVASDAGADDAAAVRAVVADFHQALAEGYRERVLQLLAEDVAIFETGDAETRREQYAAGHLAADLEFAAAVRREPLHSTAQVSGDLAWVLTQSRSDGEFRGVLVKLENTETMVLRRSPDGWKIVHIHWSGHERREAAR